MRRAICQSSTTWPTVRPVLHTRLAVMELPGLSFASQGSLWSTVTDEELASEPTLQTTERRLMTFLHLTDNSSDVCATKLLLWRVRSSRRTANCAFSLLTPNLSELTHSLCLYKQCADFDYTPDFDAGASHQCRTSADRDLFKLSKDFKRTP